jgi:hypothetical protein
MSIRAIGALRVRFGNPIILWTPFHTGSNRATGLRPRAIPLPLPEIIGQHLVGVTDTVAVGVHGAITRPRFMMSRASSAAGHALMMLRNGLAIVNVMTRSASFRLQVRIKLSDI